MDEGIILELPKGKYIAKFSDGDDFDSFDCGDADINEFLKDDALDHIKKDLATVYVVEDENSKILAYATMSMSAIKLKHRQEDVPYRQLPAVLLGRLGVDEKSKYDSDGNKNYYGYELIDLCTAIALGVKEEIGCCYIFVHAYPNLVDYYAKKGFETEKDEKFIAKNLKKKERGKKFDNVPMYFRLETSA